MDVLKYQNKLLLSSANGEKRWLEEGKEDPNEDIPNFTGWD